MARIIVRLSVVHGVDEISEWKAGEFEDVQENGLQVFLVAQDMLVTIFDAWESWRIFHGKHTSKQAQREIETYMNFTYTERAKTVVALPEAMIQTGDVFAITRMDSTDLFIQIGCGSRVGHVAIAVWMEGVLHVCEAVGANHCDGLWPAPHGIICTPYSRWLNLGLAVDYLTSFLPLHPQYRARLNEADLVSFVESVLGLPYGNNNFFYTWLDTPEDNFPPPLSSATVVVGLPMYERIYKLPYNDSSSAYTFVIAGMNKRLGIDCTDSNCLFRYLDDMNITFTDAMIISEQDSWTYSGNRSLVCSSFVLASLKAAGVFGDLDFQATEAQPGDIYRLQIYDDTWNKPDGCATETGPTCQLMGALNLDLPDANTVNPHANMFSRCGGVPPDYSRTPNC
eukprot:TRINITY_DN2443_c0_g1_i1.p1 TRINITY_DN2443_c0_g1~~TRINITY_DN2443_c0_g1_i1.p1  ORF type:complete len:396 (+),score=50.78 TRINITY_DN2443_c0_g1_i1:352-1539(+)